MIFHNTKLINLGETAVSLLFFALLIVLFGGSVDIYWGDKGSVGTSFLEIPYLHTIVASM